MKKTLTLLFALGSVVLASAQQKQSVNGNNVLKMKPRKLNEEQIRAAKEQGEEQIAQFNQDNRGASFFSEDFANGVAGNNGVGAWTIDDSGNDGIWMLATATSPGGFYSDPTEGLVSTSEANGWMIFDADLFQGGEITATNPAEDVTGYLTSPVLDLSAQTSVILSFEQAFRYCCADDRPIFVEVTNDGGTTWVVFDGAPGFTGGANDASANPMLTTIDISGVAAGESAVQFRFGWQANGNATHSHYFWGVDDILLYPNPVQNDIEVTYVSTGDILADFEYRAIPLDLANPADLGGMIVGTIYRNIGVNAQDATITCEILDATNTVVATASQTIEMLATVDLENPADFYDTLFVATNWVPDATGDYSVRTTVTYASEDATPTNNTMSKNFTITTDEYGHDDITNLNDDMRPFAGTGTAADPFAPVGYGSYLTVNTDGSSAYGLTVRFDSSTDTNCPITALLMQQGDDYNLTDGELVAGAEYEVDADWTPAGNQSYPYYLPFEEAAELAAGARYFVAIQTNDETTQELGVQSTGELDADFSTGIWAETTEGTFIWFFGLTGLTDDSPAIRLITSERVGIEENAQLVNDLSVGPNPAVNTTRVNFKLDNAKAIAYEIRDMQGRLITFANKGVYQAGAQSFEINVSDIAAGNYMLNIVLDGTSMVSTQLVVSK
jgi:hypothetical protein